jgi:deferrochelatase/peroxidase EfeB
MSKGGCPFAGRRGFLAGAGGLLAAGAALPLARAAAEAPVSGREPFYGPRQGGILTPAQKHTYFASLDLTTESREAVISLFRAWTEAAAKLTAGEAVAVTPLTDPTVPDDGYGAPPGGDSGDAMGIGPARLTLTFGFGPGLFLKDGKDRFGIAKYRPDSLEDLPKFNGDQMMEGRVGGDLSIQACADDPQVAFHAIRALTRIAGPLVENRWAQRGFSSAPKDGGTPRNLMGFKDGTRNPDAVKNADAIWAGDEAPAWLRGGSYVVVRRIRIALEHWERTPVDFQQQVIGREKVSGCPLGGTGEFDTPDFNANDKDGNPVIAENAHLRLSAPETQNNIRILRRGYSFDDGVVHTAERWPPWRQAMLYDAGLLFVAYQRDPRTGFIPLFAPMAKLDMLNQFATHVGSGLFAVPPGVAEGKYLGQALFEGA